MGKNKNWFIESTVEAGEVVINDGGSSVDFRIEGDTDSNLFVTDGSADKVGIGTNSPDTKFHVTSDTIGELLSVSNHNVSSSMPSEMILQKSRGSKSAPATLGDGDEIGKITFKGYDGSNYDELAHIKVASTSVSSDTSSMTFHSDKFVLDTGSLQFGTSGQSVNSIVTTVTNSSTDNELLTAKAAYDALTGGAITFTNDSGSNTWVGTDANAGKVYYLSTAAANGTFSQSVIQANATKCHIGGAVGSEVFKVTGTTAIAGATTITGATQITGDLTVGVDDTGHDVKFFGASSGKYLLWDQSGDTLKLGAVGGTKGVGLIAYGTAAGKKLDWNHIEDELLVYGDAVLGYSTGDTIKIKGLIKPTAYNTSVNIRPFNALQTADILIVQDKDSADALSVEADGKVSINKDLSFANPHSTSIDMGDTTFGDSGTFTLLDYDPTLSGSKGFAITRGGGTEFKIDSGLTTIHTSSFLGRFSTEVKFRTAAFKINNALDSASGGQLEVAKVTTSSGGLTLDSQSGTTTVDDNLTVTGDISVTGASNFSGTTNASFHLDTGGSNLGWKAISLTDSADNTTVGLAINKWLHPVDSTGNTSTAGIIAKNIHTEAASMTISTKGSGGLLVLAPGYNHDSGTVSIGTSVDKQANLLCYGNATVSGNLTVSGTVSGSFAINGTSESTFQIDNGGSGPKLHVGSDDLIQTVNNDGSTLEQIHTSGILLDSVKGASTNMSFKSYNGYMKMQPGTNANTSRYLWLEGSIKIRSMGALTYNYIGGTNKIGAEAHGNFATTDDLSAGDTKIYMDNGELFFDASANVASFRTSDLVFGATDTSGSNSTDGNQVKFYGNATAAYMQWLQSSNKLILNGNGVGSDVLNVKAGNAIFGVLNEDKCDVKFNGAAGEVVNIDSGESTVTFGKGVIQAPTVASNETINLELTSSSYQFANLASGHVIYNLPVVTTPGQRFKIMVADFTNNLTINCDGSDTMLGGVVHLDGGDSNIYDSGSTAAAASTASTSVVFTAPYEGTWIELISNGTNWYVTGQLVADASPAFN